MTRSGSSSAASIRTGAAGAQVYKFDFGSGEAIDGTQGDGARGGPQDP